ncbi:hypothetical protein FHS16_005644 [Paenibacillus endophyticus]|uniref:GNAT family N-acetyltransferase n=1 Tax=Paenibacillus endophyticus TaxID=1294268 RepID=A0A7W5CD60_9BACL|nr:hypothetical protein [Paenibacillus endophyticus]
MKIKVFRSKENYPMELLLSADPSLKLVEEYVKRGECFIAENDNQIVGTYVLLRND